MAQRPTGPRVKRLEQRRPVPPRRLFLARLIRSREPEHSFRRRAATEGHLQSVLLAILAARPFDAGSEAILPEDWQGAVAAFTDAIEEKRTATAYINRGIAYGHLGKAKEALTDYNAAQKLEPTNPAVYTNRATLLSRAGYTEHALADYGRALKLKPDAAVHAMRGSVHHGAKDYAKAKADYLEALKLNANEHTALNNLAWLQATCAEAEYRDGDSAVKLATKVCELTKWRVKAYASTLAAAHAEGGNFAKAVEVAERFSDPNVKLYRDSKPKRDG